MKRYILLPAFAMTLIVTLILTSGLALAEPQFPAYHSVETFCSAGSAERGWSADSTHHGRNALYTSKVESDNPDLAGENAIYVNWNLNLKTWKGLEWGTFELSVPGTNNGWRGNWQGEAYLALPLVLMEPDGNPLWLAELKGTGHGFGSFHGKQTKFESFNYVTVFDEEPTGFPCVTGKTIDGKWFVLQSDQITYVIE